MLPHFLAFWLIFPGWMGSCKILLYIFRTFLTVQLKNNTCCHGTTEPFASGGIKLSQFLLAHNFPERRKQHILPMMKLCKALTLVLIHLNSTGSLKINWDLPQYCCLQNTYPSDEVLLHTKILVGYLTTGFQRQLLGEHSVPWQLHLFVLHFVKNQNGI